MSLTEEETKGSSLKTNEQVLQNVVTCVANLSLVSPTCDVCATCTTVKDNHPVVKSIRNVPETGIKRVATAAADGVQPSLTKPEPQVSVVKEHACQGVDERKEPWPVLQPPMRRVPLPSLATWYKVISDTKYTTTVASAEQAISSTVGEAKNAVAGTTDVAPEAAQGSGEATKSTVTESTVGQKGASNTFPMLRRSDPWLDPFLPVAGQQLVWLASSFEGLTVVPPEQLGVPNSYSVRLGMLPRKVCQRFVSKMKDTVQSIQDALFHLRITFDLIEYSKRSVDQKRPDIQEELNKMWLTWSMGELETGEREKLLKSEAMESQILLVFRNINQRLRTACLALRFNTQGLPHQVQDRIYQLESIIDCIQTYTYAAASFQNFPGTMLELSKLKILKARILLHDLLDYVVENITLTWFGEPLASSEGTKGTEETNQPLDPTSQAEDQHKL